MSTTTEVGRSPSPAAVSAEVAAALGGDAVRRRRFVPVVAVLSVALLVVMIAANMLGAVAVAPDRVLGIVAHHVLGWGDPSQWSAAEDLIIWRIRFPRVLAGALIGAGMSIVGMAIQAMVRNPIADPYVLGVSSGASLGAVIVIYFGGALGTVIAPSSAAFLGALATLVAVFALSQGSGGLSSIRLLLIGVAFAYALSGITQFFLYASDSASDKNEILFWILGSLGAAHLSDLVLPALALVLALGYLGSQARRLNALSVGDEAAIALGVDPSRLRAVLLVICAVFIGAAVAVAGPIGFIGLVVPHVARMLVGADHFRVLVTSAILGAAYLVAVDLISRVILQPVEVPIGVLTAVLGTPIFVWLVRRNGSAALRGTT
ncbi:MAG TPA: iron ABC transporter permease [Solirubrobacteraceae bacterium]|nr:iron ABC transporter permease [Solirubrobacteraceae bacterium]